MKIHQNFIVKILNHLKNSIKPDPSKVEKPSGPFSQLTAANQLETGDLKSPTSKSPQRQVSFRMHRKNILRKTFVTSDKWKGAAARVKLTSQVRKLTKTLQCAKFIILLV